MTATTAALAGARLAHLACHGRLRADNPSFSALELADGHLTECVLIQDEGRDTTYVGDELLGFVSALLARGAVGIVASVVAVGDVESVRLMEQLHRELARGLSMAEALHAARATLDAAEPREFVNWCTFTAYGAG